MGDPGRAGSPSLRIALVCPYSLSRPGGVQGQVVGLARALGLGGHRVTVFAPVDPPVDGRPLHPPDIDVVATGRSVAVPANGSVAPVSLSPLAAARALRAVESVGYDVVHVHEPLAPGLPWAVLVGDDVPPVVATFHRHGSGTAYRLLGPLARRAAGRLAVRAAVSRAAADTVAEVLGGTCEIGFNGIETDLYRNADPWPKGDRPTVVFLGRHEERKGLAVLLDAFDRMPASAWCSGVGPGIGSERPQLWIAGDGPRTAALQALHPESADISWLGVLTESEKVRRLAAADVLCAPSLGGESFGMVILEALAARTPVVASDIDGYRDAAGGCAVLVAPGDSEALSAALAGVLSGRLAVLSDDADPSDDLDDPDTPSDQGVDPRRRWLAAGARRAEEWSMERLAGWYEELYHRAMVGPRS